MVRSTVFFHPRRRQVPHRSTHNFLSDLSQSSNLCATQAAAFLLYLLLWPKLPDCRSSVLFCSQFQILKQASYGSMKCRFNLDLNNLRVYSAECIICLHQLEYQNSVTPSLYVRRPQFLSHSVPTRAILLW